MRKFTPKIDPEASRQCELCRKLDVETKNTVFGDRNVRLSFGEITERGFLWVVEHLNGQGGIPKEVCALPSSGFELTILEISDPTAYDHLWKVRRILNSWQKTAGEALFHANKTFNGIGDVHIFESKAYEAFWVFHEDHGHRFTLCIHERDRKPAFKLPDD